MTIQNGSKRGVRYTAPSRQGFIYFIQVGNDGPIKIGFTSNDPFLRQRVLTAASPHILRLIGFFPSVFAEEARIHSMLATDLLRAEWFHPTERVLNVIRSLVPSFDGKTQDEAEYASTIRQQIISMVAA